MVWSLTMLCAAAICWISDNVTQFVVYKED